MPKFSWCSWTIGPSEEVRSGLERRQRAAHRPPGHYFAPNRVNDFAAVRVLGRQFPAGLLSRRVAWCAAICGDLRGGVSQERGNLSAPPPNPLPSTTIPAP